ncbi:MAG: SOS response-associated peptidase family protein [Acidobacteriaceae bacterium]
MYAETFTSFYFQRIAFTALNVLNARGGQTGEVVGCQIGGFNVRSRRTHVWQILPSIRTSSASPKPFISERSMTCRWRPRRPTTSRPARCSRSSARIVTGEREMVAMRSGMVPHFAKSPAEFKGFSTINAKAETLLSRAIWRVPFHRRRCLIPADGFTNGNA